eukprot:CAMPEP_0181080396 /NCGR_PEP_ID=MMETSP1071-20121207/2544_1 /TAXON_ID=35127 /ORGANISM="Thalassiosira sp., Strain NH16" /LENGTH=433 /DNA_ID=CAMNT_0023161869 /DNA_START=82 /DNA_END=1379 /DNA_ORIENTATION=+
MSLQLDAHFIFLVHGFMGNPDELSYAEDSIKKAAIQSNSDTAISDTNINIITHRVTCNIQKTFDGIEAGGKRVANEVQDFVSNHITKAVGLNNVGMEKHGEDFHASISFIGYSLGGMYARYAISVLPLKFDRIRLHPLSFATAATPHLGLASNSYVILPRFLEYLMGYGFGRSGQDLFRLHRGKKKRNDAVPDDIVYEMATADEFLAPLSAFHRRVSYVNAFGTDLMVPLATSGILSPYSNSCQYLSPDYDHWNKEEIGFDVCAFQTKQYENINKGLQSSGTRSSRKDEALTMSLSLDSLGWKKVFVDCRKGMSSPSIRCICRHPRKDLMNDAVSKKKDVLQRDELDNDTTLSFESRELCEFMKTSEYWHLAPTGHFLLVAHSKTRRGARKFAKGRPLVDQAALDFVNYVKEFQMKIMDATAKSPAEEKLCES